MHIGTRGFENAPAVPPELSPRRGRPCHHLAGDGEKADHSTCCIGHTRSPYWTAAARRVRRLSSEGMFGLPNALAGLRFLLPPRPADGAVQEHGSEGRFGLDRGRPPSRVVLSPRTDRRLSERLRHAYWPRQRHLTICGCPPQVITTDRGSSTSDRIFLPAPGHRDFFFASRAACTVASSFSPRRSLPLATICPVSPSTRKAAGIALTPYRREISASQYLPS